MTTLKRHRLDLTPLSSGSFAPYGTYAEAPGGNPDWVTSGDRLSGVVEDTEPRGTGVSKLWKLGDLAFDSPPYMGHVRYWFQGFQVAQLERHRGETQIWQGVTGVSVVVVALGDLASPVPRLETTAAFLVAPGDLIAIGRGVWQCHFLPIGDSADFTVITARREPEQDRDLVDLRATAAVVLEVALDTPRTDQKGQVDG